MMEGLPCGWIGELEVVECQDHRSLGRERVDQVRETLQHTASRRLQGRRRRNRGQAREDGSEVSRARSGEPLEIARRERSKVVFDRITYHREWARRAKRVRARCE